MQHGSPKATGKITEEGVAQQLLRAFPNLYAELSDAMQYLRRDEDFAVRLLCEFQDKLFFGTDCCNSETECQFEGKLWFDRMHESGKLPTEVWKKICRNNAIDFFKLDLERA